MMTPKTRTLLPLLALLLLAAPGFAEDVVPAYEPSQTFDVDPVELPTVVDQTLDNGLHVYYIADNELPVVSARLFFPAGKLFNPMDKPGLNNFMADMLTKGTETRSAQELAAEMDFIGGNLASGAGNNTAYITASALSRELPLVLELMADVTMNPTFPPEEIERQRMQLVSGLMTKVDDAGTIASEQWDHWVYGGHPYSMPTAGTVSSAQAFTREDLVEQHKKLIVPGHAVLILAGDVDPKKAHKLVKQHFGGWEGTEPPEVDVDDPEAGEGRQILLVDKPDAVQSEVRIGYIMAPYNMGDDMYAFDLMNYAYGGGGFSSRLMKRIRTELGLTYGLRSNLDARVQTGAYTIGGSTKNESTGEFISETLRMMQEAVDDGFTEQELKDAKAFRLGSYPQRFETPGGVASQFQNALLFGFGDGDPDKHISEYRQNVADVDQDAMNAMAKKYLDPDKVRIVVVGKAEVVKPQLEQFGDVTVKTLDELKEEM